MEKATRQPQLYNKLTEFLDCFDDILCVYLHINAVYI